MFRRIKETKVLFVATEESPFAKIGGLGEVIFSLPRALKDIGYDARVMIPRYGTIDCEKNGIVMEYEGLKVPTEAAESDNPEYLICNVKKYTEHRSQKSPVTTYFLENQEYYEKRANVYGYEDDPVRWALLSRGAIEFIKVSKWVPDIIVASDWMTGFLPNYLKTTYKDDEAAKNIATVFSIHNLAHQSALDHRFVAEMDYDGGHSAPPPFFSSRQLKANGMRRGIIFADVVNTVSENYAKEILTKEYGEFLDDLLKERRSALFGILNGIDYDTWNPERDPYIKSKFSASSLNKRKLNKRNLQSRFGLPEDDSVFVMGVVSRLDKQKGFSLLSPFVEQLINEVNIQIIVLGDGSTELKTFFHDLEKKYPKQVAAHLEFDAPLAHMIYAGADTILIPSKFEPSGLTQMEAMHYGAVPIVRKTGGLADTVVDYNPIITGESGGTGFVFDKFDSFSCAIAIIRAIENFHHKDIWERLQKRGMAQDFSWESSARKYEDIFEKAIEHKKRDWHKGLRDFRGVDVEAKQALGS